MKNLAIKLDNLLKKTPNALLCALGAVVFLLAFYFVSYRTPLSQVWLPTTMNNDEAIYNRQVVIVGTIAAGCPIIADQNIEGYAFSDIGDSENYFFLRVKGDSMVGAGIRSGALVLIKKQHYAENNQIVACLVGDESATLKRYFCSGRSVTLMPENPAYEPIVVPVSDFESGSAIILGVARRVVSDL